MRPVGYLPLGLAVVTAIIFGIFPAATRAIYADGGNSIFMIIVCTWARALALALFCVVRHKPLFHNRSAVRQGINGGIFQAISVACIMNALVFMPGPIAIIIFLTHTLMLLFFMAWRGEIKLDLTTLLTTIAALGGIGLVLDLWHAQPSGNLIGAAFAFTAALAAVGRLYVYEHQTRQRPPAVVGAENFLIAAIIVSFGALIQTPHPPASAGGYGWVLLACVSVMLGTFGMFYGISLIGSFRWSLFSKLEPIFTAIFSALLINESLLPHQYAGIGVVVGSLVIYQTVEHRRKVPSNGD